MPYGIRFFAEGLLNNLCIKDFPDTIMFTETKMEPKFPDEFIAPPECIRWTGWMEGHDWASEFPKLED
jgi:hypothetical protein